jgi:hypothetical protein
MAQTVFTFPCPCCNKTIEVDVRSGKARAVRPEEAKGGRDLDSLLGDHKKQSQRLDELWGSASDQVRRQQDRLARELERAKEDAKKNPDERPRNPFDLE